MGRGAHRQRTAAEARHSSISSNGEQVSAKTTDRSPARRYALVELSAPARQGIIACDFLLAVTATFRQLYVFVVIEHRSRRLIHCNVTAHPTAAWTLQQLREVIGLQEHYEYLLHDRDSIFASHLDESIAKLGVTVLKSPLRSPKANAVCERVIGTLRRECLDWLIPLTESHLRTVLQSWVRHYNTGRPHMALGPGVPDPPLVMPHDAASTSHPRLREGRVVRARSILGGLHHEYFWAPAGAH